MKVKDNRESNDQSIVLEDLRAENAEASKVKGGIELKECLITSYQTSGHGGGL
jgi:hypothetical protein